MKTFIFFILIFFSSVAIAPSQVLEYDIQLGSRSVGTLIVTPSNLKSKDFAIRMDAEMSLPLTAVHSVFDVKFEGGILKKAEMVQKMNGKVREKAIITRNGIQYEMNIDGIQKTMQREVTYTIAKLYHFEPKDVKEVFSERFGAYATIAEVAPHLYEITLPDKNRNTYRYENGICVEMTSKHSLARVTFRLVRNQQSARE